MQRTKATLIYRRTKNLRAVQLLLGHSKLESTVRYLGIDVDDALEIAEQAEILSKRIAHCPAIEMLAGQLLLVRARPERQLPGAARQWNTRPVPDSGRRPLWESPINSASHLAQDSSSRGRCVWRGTPELARDDGTMPRHPGEIILSGRTISSNSASLT